MTETPTNRTVIVTGAAMGNGLAIASRFLARGDAVVAFDLDARALETTRAAHWSGYGPQKLLLVAGDVSKADDIDRLVKTSLDWSGRIDVIVNNAGITGGPNAGALGDTPIDLFDAVMAVNVRGIFLLCRAVLPHMLAAGRGNIVNIASVAGSVAFPGRGAYTVSKGAVVQLTKSIATDYAAKGINCNAVCPGMIRTPMTEWRLDQPDLLEPLLARIPQREIGTPDQVADAVLFLASAQAAYFNGSAVVMDGAYTSI